MPKKHVAGSTAPNKPATKPEPENRDPNGLNSHIKVRKKQQLHRKTACKESFIQLDSYGTVRKNNLTVTRIRSDPQDIHDFNDRTFYISTLEPWAVLVPTLFLHCPMAMGSSSIVAPVDLECLTNQVLTLYCIVYLLKFI